MYSPYSPTEVERARLEREAMWRAACGPCLQEQRHIARKWTMTARCITLHQAGRQNYLLVQAEPEPGDRLVAEVHLEHRARLATEFGYSDADALSLAAIAGDTLAQTLLRVELAEIARAYYAVALYISPATRNAMEAARPDAHVTLIETRVYRPKGVNHAVPRPESL